MIDLKDYREQPDEGLFEKIQRRVAMRRVARTAGIVASVAVVGMAVWFAFSQNATTDQPQQAALVETGTTVTVADNTIAPTIGTVADNAPEQPIATNLAMSIDNTPEVAEITPLEEKAPDCWFSSEELESMIREIEAKMPGEKPAAPTEVAAVSEDTPTSASDVATVEQATESVKAGVQNPHYDNIIWAPNIIIPNGEIEENRVFSIQATSAITEFSLQIFNRRGMRVYSTADPSFRWNAANMPQGAYIWVATFRDTDGRPRREKGSVVVVR